MYKIIQRRKIWLTLSTVLVVASIVALALWGLKFGIDFTGGSLLEVRFNTNNLTASEVKEKLQDMDLGSLVVQPTENQTMLLRFQDTSDQARRDILDKLNAVASSTPQTATSTLSANAEALRFDSIGPSIGQELKSKAVNAIFIVLVIIILYIALAFQKVSKPVSSWKYGIIAIIALFHDVLITLGVFAVLGKFLNIEINTAFVAAILTVLGYSVNDTIVVFDRIRENLPKSHEDFEHTINRSVNQTLTRSINTSATTLIVLLAILFFGGNTIKDFILALSIGVFVGTYSSIFLASPLLVVWEKFKKHI